MQKFLNFKKFGFTLIELIIVMTIAAILAGVGFSGYMDSMHVQKRQDAALSLQKAYLLINTAGKNNINTSLAAAAGSPCSPTTSPSTDCASSPVCNYTPGTTLNFPCKSKIDIESLIPNESLPHNVGAIIRPDVTIKKDG